MSPKELDFNELQKIADKYQVTPNQAYLIYCEVDNIIVRPDYPVIVQEEQGYKGDIHSQEE